MLAAFVACSWATVCCGRRPWCPSRLAGVRGTGVEEMGMSSLNAESSCSYALSIERLCSHNHVFDMHNSRGADTKPVVAISPLECSVNDLSAG
ncbi:hypothetical protein LEMLEM_LOCUS16357 [Lemmus lemmus]